jgi:hypothetical protein
MTDDNQLSFNLPSVSRKKSQLRSMEVDYPLTAA